MTVLSKSDNQAVRRAMSEMPYGAGLTPHATPPDYGLTGAEVAEYLRKLGDSLRYHAKLCEEDTLSLRVLRAQQRHVGRFLRGAFAAAGEDN